MHSGGAVPPSQVRCIPRLGCHFSTLLHTLPPRPVTGHGVRHFPQDLQQVSPQVRRAAGGNEGREGGNQWPGGGLWAGIKSV